VFHGLPSQKVKAQTTTIVTSELVAMATTDGGGDATVIPATVKTRMRTDSAASQNFFATESLAPDKKR